VGARDLPRALEPLEEGQRLEPELARARLVGARERHHTRLGERPRPKFLPGQRGELDGALQPAARLFDVAPDPPEVAQRGREP
jgi:hypothetical protein